jgi:DNA-binding MarR family transcriptional regulator
VLLAPSLSRILRDLEARGLVERAAVRSDLRRARIRVSAVGGRLIAAIAPDSEATYDSITRQFGRDRLNALFALLNELEQALETEAPLPGGDQRPRADSRSMRRDARKE